MNREIRVKRIFSLGNYQNIEIEDKISDIPEELVFKEAFISKIRNLLNLSIESQFQSYKGLREKTMNMSSEEAYMMLESDSVDLIKNLFKEQEN